MDNKGMKTGIVVIIAAVVLTAFIIIVGIDEFVLSAFIFILWAAVGLCASAVGYMISFAVDVITGKDKQSIIMPVVPCVLILITLVLMYNESKGFMGYLGVSIIFSCLTFPLIITAIIWVIHSLVKKRKNTDTSKRNT